MAGTGQAVEYPGPPSFELADLSLGRTEAFQAQAGPFSHSGRAKSGKARLFYYFSIIFIVFEQITLNWG